MPAPPQPPPRPPHRAERDTLDVMVPHARNPRSTPEDLAPFAEFNRRRAVERAWEREARAAPGTDAAVPGAHGAGRRYWVNGRCELAAGGTRGKTMHDAAAMGDARAVARRLERGEHPDQGDFLSQTPLHHAAARGKTSAVVALLDGGANADARDVNGRTPLHCAAVANCGGNIGPETTLDVESKADAAVHLTHVTVPSPPFVDVISTLVTRGGANVNARDDKGFTPLHAAAARGHYRCAVALIRAGADVKATCLRRRKPVDYAYGLDAPHLVSLLTDPSGHLAGRDPAVEGSKPRGGAYAKPAAPAPPYDAPFDGFPSSLKDFKDPSDADADGRNANHNARLVCTCGRRRDACACAWRRRRNPGAAAERQPPAVEGPAPPIIGAYYWRDGQPNEPARRGGNMHEDAAVGDVKAIADRLCAGEHPDQRNHAGATPMHAAAAAGHEVVVKNLIDGGGDRDATDARGRTPLMEACARGRLECVRTLLRRGANPGAVDDMGRNAMHHAALAGGGDDVVAIVDALFDNVQQCSTTPVTHFANPRTPRRPHPVVARDLGGRTPAQLCRAGAVKSRLVDLTQDVERRARTGGTERERPCPSRVPSVLPAEWARRARMVAEGIDPWPGRTCVEATRLISDILTAVENTGSGLVSAGEEGAQLSALERMRALGCMPPALCKRVAGAWTKLAKVGSAGDRSVAKEGSDACVALVDWCSS